MANTAKFPGRRNKRRIAALGRLERQLASGIRRNHGHEDPLGAADRSRLLRQLDTLTLRIRPADIVRAIRTKKDRSGTGKIARG